MITLLLEYNILHCGYLCPSKSNLMNYIIRYRLESVSNNNCQALSPSARRASRAHPKRASRANAAHCTVQGVNRPTETGSAGHHNSFFLSCLAEMDEFAESSFSSQPQVRIRRSSYISQPSAHTAPVGWSPRAATPVLRHRLSTNSVRSDAYVGLFVICIGIVVLTRSF